MKKKTNEEFNKELQLVNTNIIPLEKYNGANIPINFMCKKDKHKWKARPSSILYGQGCPICGNVCKSLSQLDSQEVFENKLLAVNNTIQVIGKYTGSKNKILCKCKIDGTKWLATPSLLLQGRGCPICGRKTIRRKLTRNNKSFIDELKICNPSVKLLESYEKSNKKVRCKCLICDHEWHSYPSNLIRGHSCPKCVGKTKNTTDFIKEIKIVNSDLKIIGEYINSQTPILCECKIDGTRWNATPNNLLSGTGCPKCKSSKGEKSIRKVLNQYCVEFEYQKKFDDLTGIKGRLLSYDFYLPQKNILIEYNGIQHYIKNELWGGQAQLESQQEHDKRKKQYAKKNNLKLVIIPYWDYKNIEKIINNIL